MNNDFQILFELLEDRPLEVTGRATGQVPSELRERIARFAAGTSTEEERDQMKKMLSETPDLVGVLVTETKALRQSNE